DDPASRRRRWIVRLGLLAAALVTAGSLALTAMRQPPNARELCSGARGRLAGIWDDARREQLRAAFAATGEPNATAAAPAVGRAFDDYASVWADRHTEACVASAVRHEQSSEMLDRRMACLANHLKELDALAAVLSQADASIVGRAVGAANAL